LLRLTASLRITQINTQHDATLKGKNIALPTPNIIAGDQFWTLILTENDITDQYYCDECNQSVASYRLVWTVFVRKLNAQYPSSAYYNIE
jgi:hypothetical protein